NTSVQIRLEIPRRISPLLLTRLWIMDDVGIQFTDLHIRQWQIAKVHPHAVVAFAVQIGIDRSVDGIPEGNEVAQLEARARQRARLRRHVPEKESRDEQTS